MQEKKIMIVTVGGSPEPIIYSLKTHKPKFIYFIPSKDTQKIIHEIVEAVFPPNGRVDHKSIVVENAEDLPAAFKTCQEAFLEIKNLNFNEYEVLADLTGGTKVMSAALVLAAAYQGAQIVYVSGSQRTKEGVGIVESGTERVIYRAHPYDITAKSQIESFRNNFNSCRFEAAIADCEVIIGKGNESLKNIFGALKDICEAYRWWDLFNFKRAAHHLNCGKDRLQKLLFNIRDLQSSFSRYLSKITDHLKRLNYIKTDDFTTDLVEELVANAKRRAAEGKYDDAVARLYRALELLAQVEFRQVYGRSTTQFPLSLFEENIRNKIYPNSPADREVDIGCQKAFEILAEMGKKIGSQYSANKKEIHELLSARNNSIMAHGTSPLDKKDFDKFLKIFDKFNIDYAKIEFPEFDPDWFAVIELIGAAQ